MDDSEHVCPLCCEELDISDREFYPCKCGYQVCMWCWHRIRESESGLCPACRTPYGEDPHQFSAVDVEEVLRANKEREAALKRQKQQEQEESHQMLNGASSHSTGTNEELLSSSIHRTMEVPKDRSQLANMRVIRRNLVYAVGLPPNTATEENLRKPEYFGQYGRISKIVLNRNAVTGGGDGRRASASAYVTFVHKEDTLACILALDGFYLENRNIRASYGTSKYCSAFIKNVRCNNPECTYLHEMGSAEDTFTKQEIQAGYVTSGRDVLARQQQIVAEQLRHQQHIGVVPRKRVGGGGPSGTGRSSSNPVFPPPEYDEPSSNKSSLVPPPAGISRAATASLVTNPSTIPAKMGRSASMGGRSPTLGAIGSVPGVARNKSAASIVAGVHTTVKSEDVPPHTTLTPLTPLKRASRTTKTDEIAVSGSSNNTNKVAAPVARKTRANGASTNLSGLMGSNHSTGSSSIGGDVIAAPTLPKNGSSALGGEVFTGQLPNNKNSAVGRGSEDKWNSVGGAPIPTSAGLWNNAGASGPVGGGGNNNNSSSALASILGVNLPTGSGSLRENSSLFSAGPSPLASLNSGSAAPGAGVIGGAPVHNTGSSLIGGVPIGPSFGAASNPATGGSTMGGSIGGSYSGKSDIALLQSLLPGVHITSGNEGIHVSSNANNNAGWNGVGGETLPGWGGRQSMGAIGQNPGGQQNPRQGPGIW